MYKFYLKHISSYRITYRCHQIYLVNRISYLAKNNEMVIDKENLDLLELPTEWIQSNFQFDVHPHVATVVANENAETGFQSIFLVFSYSLARNTLCLESYHWLTRNCCISLSLSLSLTHTHSHTHSLSLSLSLTLPLPLFSYIHTRTHANSSYPLLFLSRSAQKLTYK